MEKPDLNRVWETWVRIGPKPSLPPPKIVQDTIRNKIHPIVSRLMNEKTIYWYHFLLHDYPRDPTNWYFHMRFSIVKDKTVDDLDLPEYCVPPEKISPLKNIVGINKALLRNEEIEEAWRIIGEQSEWIINFISIHKEEIGWIPIDQFVQFMHFFMNMMGLGGFAKIPMVF